MNAARPAGDVGARPPARRVSPNRAGLDEAVDEMHDGETHGSMPALFIGHGSPLHIADNGHTRDLEAPAARLPRPAAILVVHNLGIIDWDDVLTVHEGIQNGTVSMRCLQVGG